MSKNMSFREKLQMISEIYFENHKQTISEEEIASVENNLQITIPELLREFYFMFGNDVNLLKCMYDIATPRELYLENNILMLAKENQNVCSYGINLDSQKPMYFDETNNVVKTVEQDTEDFLIYLLAIQGTEFMQCVGKTNAKFAPELEKHMLRLSNAERGLRFLQQKWPDWCSGRRGYISYGEK